MRVISPAPEPDDKQNLRYMIRQTRTCVATHTSAGRHILYEYIYQVCQSFVFYLSIAKTRHDANFGDIKLLYNTQEKTANWGNTRTTILYIRVSARERFCCHGKITSTSKLDRSKTRSIGVYAWQLYMCKSRILGL